MTDSLEKSDDDAFKPPVPKKKPVPKKTPDQSHQAGGYGTYQVPGYTVSTPRGRNQTHGDTATFLSQQSAFPSQQSAFPQPVPSNEPGQSYQAGGYGSFQARGYNIRAPHSRNRYDRDSYEDTATLESLESAVEDHHPDLLGPQDSGYVSFQIRDSNTSAPHGRNRYLHEDTATLEYLKSAISDPHPDLQARFNDPVSNAFGTLSLSATSLPQGPPFQSSPHLQVVPPRNESRRELSRAELEEDSIIEIGDSKFNTRDEYVRRTERIQCQSRLKHLDYEYYGARGRVRESSAHATQNYNAWKSRERKRAKGEETSSSSDSGQSDPPPQRVRLGDKFKLNPVLKIGDNHFESSENYLTEAKKRKYPCTSRELFRSHDDKDYGAPGTRSRRGRSPSPHSRKNYEAWLKKASKASKKKAAREEAPSSSGKSKSPGYHEERRERDVERERRDQPARSRGSKSGSGSKPKESTSKDGQPPKSQGKKSGSSSKPKESRSRDDTHGGGRRREHRS